MQLEIGDVPLCMGGKRCGTLFVFDRNRVDNATP